MAIVNPLKALAQEGEPALNTSRLVALVGAIIALVVAFGFSLSADKVAAIMALVVIVAPIVQGYITRAKVTPSDQVAAKLAEPGSDVIVAGPAIDNIADGEQVEVFADGAVDPRF